MEHPENSEEYKGLVVNKGIEQPSSVNPYLKRKPKKRQLSVAEFVEGIMKGDVTILSQAVTLVESVKPEHQAVSQEIIEKCLPFSGNSIRIGISGVPGAGKSTSIDVFGLHVLEKGGKLAVLAIDPSSERSKGSILGDKTRMEQLSVHPKSFIRPSPSAGSLGGVARKTRETIILCEAAGFDKIFVETVGVGQSETAVHSMVDFFLLIQLSGTGDELQGIKRGIMEMADGIVINKADGDNLERALGKTRYAVFYLVCGMGANVVSMYANLRSGAYTVSAGASGAIFGVIGGLLYAVAINRGRLEDLSTRQMVILAAFSLYHGFTSSGVNNVAHVSGLLLGVIMGAVLYRRPKRNKNWMKEDLWYGER